MEYALSKNGILSQSVYTLTLITTKQQYVYNTKQIVYEYHQISKNLFWGYQKKGTVLTAEPEKALLDLIYIRYIKNKELNKDGIASLQNDMYIDEFDLEKIRRYSKNFGPKTIRTLYELNILKNK